MVANNYTDAELMAIKPVVIDAGTVDQNGLTRGAHYRNPFCEGKRSDEPGAAALAQRWSDLHWGGKSTESDIESDPFEALREALNDGQKWFHGHEHPETGAAAFFPSSPNHPAGSDARRTLELEWEAGCVEMHDAQRSVMLAKKPQQNGLETAERLRRSD